MLHGMPNKQLTNWHECHTARLAVWEAHPHCTAALRAVSLTILQEMKERNSDTRDTVGPRSLGEVGFQIIIIFV